jgi:N4-gp56 family major capsid protein
MSQMTTTTEIANINSFYSRDLLFRAQPRLVHNRFAQVKDVPMGNSSTIKFKRYSNLSNATTALTEGVTPAGSKLGETVITATLQQYGDYITLTDKLTMTTEDPVRAEANMILGDQAGSTLDVLTRDVMVTGTNVIFSGTSNTQNDHVAAGDVITVGNIQSAEETLKMANTRWMTSFVDPATGYNTVPLPPSFIGICHVYTTKTLRAMTGFTKVELYAQPGARMDGEIGKVENTRFIETVNAKVFTGAGTSSIDVYATLIFGQFAYATSRIAGHALENIVKPLGSAGTADPLNQRETAGWKATFVAKILNDDFIIRIVHARV